MRLRSAAVLVCAIALLIPATTSAGTVPKPKGEPCPGVRDSLKRIGARGVREAMLCLVNFERTARKLPKLSRDKRLDAAAQGHSKDMAKRGYFDHYDQNGKDPGDRLKDEGYKWIAYGENIYLGPDTALELMKGWMGSSGHCRNILSPSFRDFGFGIAERKGKVLSTQDFGTVSGESPSSNDKGPAKGCPQKLRYKR